MSSSVTLNFTRHTGNRVEQQAITINELVIAGWTSRNPQAVKQHIAELENIGVARPASTPCFYRVAAQLLTIADKIQVVGSNSSGEVEFVLFNLPDGLWVGLGSDHTDRKLERHSVPLSKQVCAKPIAPELWRFSDVADHWDCIILRSFAINGTQRHLYQEGALREICKPNDLIERYVGPERQLPLNTAMFCGTLPVHGPLLSAERFEFELVDPILKRQIGHSYTVKILSPIGSKIEDFSSQRTDENH